jgi:hypothetical protein
MRAALRMLHLNQKRLALKVKIVRKEVEERLHLSSLSFLESIKSELKENFGQIPAKPKKYYLC